MHILDTVSIGVYESGKIPPITLRHRLRIAREDAGLEQEELAAMIGVSRNTVGNAERGSVRPRRIVVNAWGLACGVKVSWLLGDDQHTADSKLRMGRKPVDLRAGLCRFPHRSAG